MEIAHNEVLRYLGYRCVAADERITSIIAELIDLFSANVIPKSVYGVLDSLEDMTARSQNLAQHLDGCRRFVLLAATLGTEADMLIRRFSVQDMEKAVIAQAVCAAMLEAYCDEIECELAHKPEFDGLYSISRFNPGYGDFNIVHQKDILNMLHCSSIGITLTEGYMLIPSKSVTAVIGFSREKRAERRQIGEKCAKCADLRCQFREAV